MSQISTAEKIETIVGGYLKSRMETGKFGAIYRNPDGSYTATVDGGESFNVRTTETGWRVRSYRSRLAGEDQDLFEAARLATTV